MIKMKKVKLWAILVLTATVLTGCGQVDNTQENNGSMEETVAQTENDEIMKSTTENAMEENSSEENIEESDNEESQGTLPNLAIRFGETEDRPVYEIQLEDNEVSLAFVRVLQEREQTIPIYVFDGSENTDVLQYYDIPASYNIPDGEPVSVESEAAGEVYYSAPFRIMLFFKDGQVPGDYVKVGTVTTTEGLAEAVESNPLDAWQNKRVIVSIAE